jgi:hypothetical protein
MAVPYDCDALLPAAERYTSMKFRRVAPLLWLDKLDWGDALELAAFVETVGLRRAKWIFHWPGGAVRAMRQLAEHMKDHIGPYVEANMADVTRDDGLKCLRAMQDGGWTYGSLPPLVRLALLDMRDEGLSMPKIARATGLTPDQVNNCVNTGRGRSRALAVPVGFHVAG